MKKIITPKNKNNQREVVVPSEHSLGVLKQFARSYFVENKLPKQIREVCVN